MHNYAIVLQPGKNISCYSQCKLYEIHYSGYTITLGSTRQSSCDSCILETVVGDRFQCAVGRGISASWITSNLLSGQCM